MNELWSKSKELYYLRGKYRKNILIKKRSILCTIGATKSRYASQKSKLTADQIKIGSETETETETDTFSRNSNCCFNLVWFEP